MEINLEKLSEKELFNLKNEIDDRLIEIDSIKKSGEEFKSQIRECFGDLEEDDLILCISFIGQKFHAIDYVNIRLTKREESSSYTDFSISHDTKPIECSSAVRDEDLLEKYFLSEFVCRWFFFTLSPYTWKEDLTSAMKKYENREKESYTNELNKKVNDIKSFIDTFDISTYL